MNKLNVITMVTSGDWFEYHLRRFLCVAKRVMPDANYYVILLRRGNDTIESMRELKRRVKPYFTDVTILDYNYSFKGRYIFIDMVKAFVLDAFGITEGLFVDADCDIVRSVEQLVTMHPDKQIMWIENKLPCGDIENMLKALKLPSDPPYCDMGVVYLRKSFGAEYQATLHELTKAGLVDLEHEFTPALKVWETIIRRSNSHVMLPYGYNTVNWHCEELANAYIVHFIGFKGKHERLYCDTSCLPQALVYGSTPVQLLGLPEW